MEFRQLRHFIVVAEELHFSRAAERLHIEQSPLSRSIRNLEAELGVQLLERTPRGARLTWAGHTFLGDARRVLLCLEQAKSNAKAAASGYRGTLRIAISDNIARSRLTALLARCREEEPDVGIRLAEVPISQQLHGLRDALYDAGFALGAYSDGGIVSEPVWQDGVLVTLPTRHPLLRYKEIPLAEAIKFPLVLCHPENCEGYSQQLNAILAAVEAEPIIAEQVSTHDLMLTLVAAGYGLGFSTTSNVTLSHHQDIVFRALIGGRFTITTYLLRPGQPPSQQLQRLIGRIHDLRERETASGPNL